ncbi:MAG: flagellar basal body rod protein FlgB [bacterium]
MDLLSSSVTDSMISSLNGLSLRHKALASNIANADTPGYKRVDVAFEGQLSEIINNERAAQLKKEQYSAQLMNSPTGAITLDTNLLRFNVLNAVEQSLTHKDFKPQINADNNSPENNKGNSVQIESEMSELAKNGMTYNAVAQLLSKKYAGLADVIKQAGG